MFALVASALVASATALNLAETVCDSAVHTTLCAAAGASPNALAVLTGEDDYTLLAPTDDAFAALEATVGFDIVTYLLSTNEANADALFSTLAYHLVSGVVLAADLTDGAVTTANGADLTVDASAATFTDEIGQVATVTTADVAADNGVLHIVDTVVVTTAIFEALPTANIPETAAATETLATLTAALGATSLDETLAGEGPFTVFAPTDDAFTALQTALGWDYLTYLLNDNNLDVLSAIVTGHAYTDASAAGRVYSSQLTDEQEITTVGETTLTIGVGEGVTVATDAFTATVEAADVDATNGVVHIIDTVLVTAAQAGLLPTQTVVDIVVESEDHTTLETALTEAELVETLSGEGPFTVFAPTDAAFAALPEGLLDELLDDPTGALAEILTYHVYTDASAAGRVYSTQLSDGQEIMTVNGASVTVSVSDSGVMINGATVTTADIDATNGVVHVIDAVLVPAADGDDDDDDDDDSGASSAAPMLFGVVALLFAALF